MAIVRREATAILSSLNAGVVPRAGLRHIAVGRLREIEALSADLGNIREGGAAFRFVVGRYGSGKTFLLQLARSYALESRFVVADADFSPDRRLQGSGGQGRATFRELMKNLSTQTRPDGNALQAILERWISNIQSQIATTGAVEPHSPQMASAVESAIHAAVQRMRDLVHGYDFGAVIAAYYRGFATDNDQLKSDALRWLRGEFATKTEAREALGVRTIIDDETYYDYLKVFAQFVRHIGYAGLLITLDEAVNLYKITTTVARSSNYEKLLSMLNDCLQGQASGLGFIIGGTPEFVEDRRRGLFSYEALRSRLATGRFSIDGVTDLSGPVISVPPLTPEELFVLLHKVAAIHGENVPGGRLLADDAIMAFLDSALRRAGAAEFTTPRDIVRDFVNLLNVLSQTPGTTWQQLLETPVAAAGSPQADVSEESSQAADPLDRFTNFRVGNP